MAGRLLKPREYPTLIVVVLCLVITFASFGVAGGALWSKGQTFERADRQACLRINKLDQQIQIALKQSLKTTPRIQYYQEHPDELLIAMQNIRAQIKLFRPQECK